MQTIGVLGIDGERDSACAGALGQRLQSRIEFGVHAPALCELVARMQGRELH